MMEKWVSLRGEELTEEVIENYSGVGFIKSESIGLSTGYSPFIKERLSFIGDYIEQVCLRFKNRPVFYRLNCHSSRTMNCLLGNINYLNETSPFLGLIGVRRYMEYPSESKKEFELLSQLSKTYDNLGVVLPFVNDVSQYVFICDNLQGYGFNGEIGIMLEIPSAVLTMKEFIKKNCKYFLIGSNDLTQLILGVARYEPTVSKHFNRSHRAVINMIEFALLQKDSSNIQIGLTGYLNKNDIDTYSKLGLNFISYYL